MIGTVPEAEQEELGQALDEDGGAQEDRCNVGPG
jgi:hypothetical protein